STTAGLDNAGAGLTAVTNNATANGSATNSVKAVVTDANGNPLSGVAVSFSATNGATVVTPNGTTGADGSVTVTLTSTTAGQSTVTATANGSSAAVPVTFSVDVDPVQSTITASQPSITANGT